MKKFYSFIAVASMMLSSVIGFTSCDKDNDAIDNTNPEKKESTDNDKKTEDQTKTWTVTSKVEFLKDAPADAGEQLTAKLKSFFQSKISDATIEASWTDNTYKMTVTPKDGQDITSSVTFATSLTNLQEYNTMIEKLGFVRYCNINIKGETDHEFNYTPIMNYEGTWEATDAAGVKYTMTLPAVSSEKYVGTMNYNNTDYTCELTADGYGTVKDSASKKVLGFEVKDLDAANRNQFTVTLRRTDSTHEDVVFKKK